MTSRKPITAVIFRLIDQFICGAKGHGPRIFVHDNGRKATECMDCGHRSPGITEVKWHAERQ